MSNKTEELTSINLSLGFAVHESEEGMRSFLFTD